MIQKQCLILSVLGLIVIIYLRSGILITKIPEAVEPRQKETPSKKPRTDDPGACVSDLDTYIIQHQIKRSQRYLLWKCSGRCGGLGDRINGLVQSFSMAICTNRTFFVQGWPDLASHLEPNKVMWDYTESFEPTRTIEAMDNRQNPFLQDPTQFSKLQENGVEIHTNLWMGNDDRSDIHSDYMKLFHTLFRWKESFVRQVEREKEFLGLANQQYIAMHIRTGQTEWEDLSFHSSKDFSLFLDCVKRLQKLFQQQCSYTPRIFLAADSPHVKDYFREQGLAFVTRNDTITHIDRSPGTDHANAWMDLKLLADSDYLITSTRSKFSELAGRFGRTISGTDCFYVTINCTK